MLHGGSRVGLTPFPGVTKLLTNDLVGIPTKLSSRAEADLSSSNATGASAFFPRFGRSSDEAVVADISLPDASGAAKDDEHLLLRVQSGDREALGILFDRYARLILSVGQRILRDNAEAEDLVHDVFLFLLNRSIGFDPAKGSARAWLAKVTYHRALDRRKYLARRCFCGTSSGADSSSHIPDLTKSNIAEGPELFYWQSYLRRAFDDLSHDQRLTLDLYFFEGFTIGEISQRLGKSPVNIRNYYYRGLERLRDTMDRRGLTK
jgi:RNA polymerase sigma-70 factor (ECF subfamily)